MSVLLGVYAVCVALSAVFLVRVAWFLIDVHEQIRRSK